MMWPFRPTDHRILDLNRKLRGMAKAATDLRAEKAELTAANDTLKAVCESFRQVIESQKAQLAWRDLEIERRDRRWAMHADRCETAAALTDFDRDQERSNSE